MCITGTTCWRTPVCVPQHIAPSSSLGEQSARTVGALSFLAQSWFPQGDRIEKGKEARGQAIRDTAGPARLRPALPTAFVIWALPGAPGLVVATCSISSRARCVPYWPGGEWGRSRGLGQDQAGLAPHLVAVAPWPSARRHLRAGLLTNVCDRFALADAATMQATRRTEQGHRRIAVRTCRTITDPAGTGSQLRSGAAVVGARRSDGVVTRQTRDDLSSQGPPRRSPKRGAVTGHRASGALGARCDGPGGPAARPDRAPRDQSGRDPETRAQSAAVRSSTAHWCPSKPPEGGRGRRLPSLRPWRPLTP